MTPDEIQAASMTGFADTSEETADDQICEHALAGLLPEPDGTLAVADFTFCPKCGEKL